jgi:hypothetical protein
VALAALGAAAVLDVGSTAAEATPSASPFAGTYVGPDPWRYVSQWTVTIADDGRIAGVRPGFSRDKISGRVGADGSYSLSVTATIQVLVRHHGHSVGDEFEFEIRTVNYKTSGDLSPDAAGNLVDADEEGGSFLWVRQ